jgi:hypothetical protein
MSTVRIQVRRGVAADWTSVNPILAAGEMGVETDTNKFKFGNGTGAWSTLAYAASDSEAIGEISQDAINTALTMGSGLTKTYNDGANTITISVDSAVVALKSYVDSAVAGLSSSVDAAYVPESDKGVAFGVASLDENAEVPSIQISNASVRDKISGGTGINYSSETGEISVGTSIATRTYVDSSLQTLVNGSPEALDTINELAAAIGNDANYTTTITTALGTKAPIASPTFTGTVTIPAGAGIDGYVKTTDLSVYSTTALNDAAYLSITNAASTYLTQSNATSTYLTQSNATSTYLALANADERIQDTAAGMLQVTAGNGLEKIYDDEANSLTLSIDQNVISTVAARDAAIVTALETAASDATTKADTAQAAADADATTKADAAAASAISAAATDATTKAANAKSEAITAAATAADTKVSDHSTDTTNVHGISDTSLLALKSEVAAVTATTLGLGDVDNTADASKPVSTAQASAIATAKSEAIADATAQVNAVIAAAPAALDTLDELAAALGDDANYATTVTTALAGKVPSATPISQKTASYTLSSINEKDSMIEIDAAGATTVTVPTDAAVAFPVGTSLDILRVGAGAVDVVGAGGVTVNATPGLKLRSQWSSATLIKRSADTWVLVGDLSA